MHFLCRGIILLSNLFDLFEVIEKDLRVNKSCYTSQLTLLAV